MGEYTNKMYTKVKSTMMRTSTAIKEKAKKVKEKLKAKNAK